MTTAVEAIPTKSFEVGSVRKKGDRVVFTILEDEDGIEYGYGTVIGEKDVNTAIVLVVLKGRRGEIRDELEIPYAELSPHIVEAKNEED